MSGEPDDTTKITVGPRRRWGMDRLVDSFHNVLTEPPRPFAAYRNCNAQKLAVQ